MYYYLFFGYIFLCSDIVGMPQDNLQLGETIGKGSTTIVLTGDVLPKKEILTDVVPERKYQEENTENIDLGWDGEWDEEWECPDFDESEPPTLQAESTQQEKTGLQPLTKENERLFKG